MVNDKVAHAVAGAAASVALLLLWWVAARYGKPAAIALGGAMLGVAYELVQKLRGDGQPDPMDALATLAGSAVVAAAVGVVGW